MVVPAIVDFIRLKIDARYADTPHSFRTYVPIADKELRALIEATAAMEMADIDATCGRMS